MGYIRSGVKLVHKLADDYGGIAELSRESGLPYSSIHSFVRRPRHRGVSFLERLIEAAHRINEARK